MHTMARVKNAHLAEGDSPEPPGREIGEAQVVEAADRLVANTDKEADELVRLYGADPERVVVVPPGVDLSLFTPGDQRGCACRGRAPAGRQGAAVRRAHPAAQGAGGARRRGGRPARAPPGLAGRARRGRARWPQRVGAGTPPRTRGPCCRAGDQRAGALRPARVPHGAGAVVPRRGPRRGALAQRVLRAGRRRGAGLRHPGRGGERRRPADSRRRRRSPRRRPRPARLVPAPRGPAADSGRREELSRRAVAHAAQFGWDRTTDRLLEVYLEACRARTLSPIGESATLHGIPSAVVP